MVEGRGGPRLKPVAASACLRRRAMKIVFGDSCGMAFAAGRKDVVSEELVREVDVRSGTSDTEVIAMALYTSRLGQGLMKCWAFRNTYDRGPDRRTQPDRFEFVTGDAVLGRRSAKRQMTTRTIVGDFLVALDEVPRTHSGFGKPKDQCAVGREQNNDLDEISHSVHPKTTAVTM